MIKPLDQLTLLQRALLAAATVVVVLILLGLASCFSDISEAEGARTVDPYGDVPLDAALLPIEKRALEEAYRAHTIRLWSVWLTDGAKDATHFRNGLRIARGAYHIAADGMAKREQELQRREQK